MTPKFKEGDRVIVREGTFLPGEGWEIETGQRYPAIVTDDNVETASEEPALFVRIPALDEDYEFFVYVVEVYPDPPIREELVDSVDYDS